MAHTDYDPIAEYYDLSYQSMTADIEMYQQLARQVGAKAHILELACGAGRVSLELAQDGFNVTGLDISQAMLELANAKLAKLPASVQINTRFVQGDMTSFDFGGQTFDLIFIAISSFQHLLTQPDQLACLRQARQHLAPAGLFVVDLQNPEEKESFPADGRLEYVHSFTRPIPGREIGNNVDMFQTATARPVKQQRRYVFFYDETDAQTGQLHRTSTRFALRYVYRYEMELLLDKSGFALEDVYGSYDFDDHDSGSSQLIYVCRRG